MQRIFITGDKWLYYKIYCGEKTADTLLVDVIKPLCEQLINNKLICKWFFIRYADPEKHLRWRLLLNDKDNIGGVISSVYTALKPYVNNKQIHKLQTDTYKRELERYGTATMEASETIFWQDSQMIVDMLNLLDNTDGEKIRWLFALRSIDQLLTDFNFNNQQKFELIKTLADSFGKEFNLNSSLIIQLSNKYRKEKENIFKFLNPSNDLNSVYLPLLNLIKTKSEHIHKPINEIIMSLEKSMLIPLNNLIGSYIHMLMNRIFRSKNRLHEMVLYGFLFRYYRSVIAKEKYNKKQ